MSGVEKEQSMEATREKVQGWFDERRLADR